MRYARLRMILAVLLLILGLVPGFAQDAAVSTVVPSGENLQLELANGLIVDLPDGALYEYEDASITINYTDMPETSDTTYTLLANPFEFELSNEELFRDVVTLRIPYDPAQLPENAPESNIFATYYYEGEWVRVRGEVDQENKQIIVHTLHNGFWTWAIDSAVNVNQEARAFLGLVAEQPETVEEAQAVVDERYDEWLTTVAALQIAEEDLGESLNPIPLAELLVDQTVHFVEHRILDVAAHYALGGKPVVLTVGGVLMKWTGALTVAGGVGIYVGNVAGDSILGARAIVMNLQAYARLQEARAVLQALENEDQTSFYPADARYINEFVELQLAAQNSTETVALDWSITAYPDSDVDTILDNITVPDAETADADSSALPEVSLQPGTYQIAHDWEAQSCAGKVDLIRDGASETVEISIIDDALFIDFPTAPISWEIVDLVQEPISFVGTGGELFELTRSAGNVYTYDGSLLSSAWNKLDGGSCNIDVTLQWTITALSESEFSATEVYTVDTNCYAEVSTCVFETVYTGSQ